MVKKSKTLLLRLQIFKIGLLLVVLGSTVSVKAQGLQFNSNDSLLAKRTSYLVFKKNQPTFQNRLNINFDLSLWDNEHLGYILNITDNKNNSYSLSSIYLNNAPYLNFNIDSKSNKITIPLALSQLKKRNWIKMTVAIDLKANTVGICINGKWFRASGFNFEGQLTPKIYFGKNEHYSDVPQMAIRNLTVDDGEQKFSFPLDEWSGNRVYSSENDDIGYVENPVWLINESYYWAPRFTRGFKEVAGINFHAPAQKLVIFKSDSLLTYDLQRNNFSEQAFQNRCPVQLLLGKSIINAKQNRLYAYETLKAKTPAASIASLDLKTLKWEAVGYGTIAEQRHHHNIFYNNTEDSLYLFGGYGMYSYHKDFFCYDKSADTWKKTLFTGDKITPRFFSGYSAADEKNEVYIFGGYGNQSGNQVVGGQHFYDLYRVNLTTHTIKKCWEIKPPSNDFVAANNLILSKDKKSFYAICYAHDKPKTSLRLYKFSIQNGSYEVVSGIIPAKGERIESDINLYYNPQQETFYCAIQEFTSPDNSSIRVYSLASPPVTEKVYLAAHTITGSWAAWMPVIWPVIVSVLFVIAGVFFYIKKRKNNKQADTMDPDDGDSFIAAILQKEDIQQKNALYLLGDFTVYDKNSRDITYLFSPKIKQLFLLILLNSKTGGGINSKRISLTLWPDKDTAKTKNIKGVTINHLRSAISNINGLELTFINDTYTFKIGEELFCDYLTVVDAISNTGGAAKQPEKNILEHFDLISRGDLLLHMSETWLDDIIVAYNDALIPLLLPEIKKIYEEGNYRKTLEMVRIVLNADPFNDTAIKYKLKALRRIKGVEYARKQYDDFVTDYEKSLGVTYAVPFDKICTVK